MHELKHTQFLGRDSWEIWPTKNLELLPAAELWPIILKASHLSIPVHSTETFGYHKYSFSTVSGKLCELSVD